MLPESAVGTVQEVQTLRQELANTRKKLQDYADTVISLHGELRTLRDGICKSCKRKFQVPPNLVASPEPAVASSSSLVKSTNPSFSWPRRLLKFRASGPPTLEMPVPQTTLPLLILPTPTCIPSSTPVLPTAVVNNIPALTSNPVPTTFLNETTVPETVPSIPRWSAELETSATAALDVAFVCAFDYKTNVKSVRFSADGKYLAVVGAVNGLICIYNVETGDKHCQLAEYASQYSLIKRLAISCVCFSPNGRYLVVGNDAGRAVMWCTITKRIRNSFKHRSVFAIQSVDFSSNGRLVVCGSIGGTVCIWNIRDGSAKFFIRTTYPGDIAWSVRFSPNGQFVTAASEGLMRIWDVRTGQLVRRWAGHESTVRSVAFTPDGRGLLSGYFGGVVKRWDVSSLGIAQSDGEPVVVNILDCGPILNTVAVSHDGQWIASGLSNKTAVIWDGHSVMRQCTLIGHTDRVYSVDFSPAGACLALGSLDGRVSLWRYTTTRMIS